VNASESAPDSTAGKRKVGRVTRHKPIFPAPPEPVPLARFSATDDLRAAIGLWIQSVHLPADKLVWGVPWYGYDYPCVNASNVRDCSIQSVPFRNFSCSDAAGSQLDYSVLMQMLPANSTTGRQWDKKQAAPWFDYTDDSTLAQHQVWYSDPESLRDRYHIARKSGLRGVGMWNADSLDYSGTEPANTQTRHMWESLEVFFR